MYHCHSDLSNLTSGTGADSVTKFDDYIELAKKYKMKALGISEHGAIINWIEKKNKIEQAGMKYLHVSEVYLTKDISGELERDNYHIVMIAKNYEGVKEMNSLISNAYEKDGHFYYNPRITFDELMSTSDNIIVTTACLGSPIWQLYKKAYDEYGDVVDERSEKYYQKLLNWIGENKHRVFLEVQYHDHDEQREFNRLLLNISSSLGVPLIAGTDTHSLNAEHYEARKILLQAKNASYGDEDEFDLTFKSYDEVVEMFDKQGLLLESVYMEAIENTNKLYDMVEDFELDKAPKYPKLYNDSIEVFKKKIEEGISNRGIDKLVGEEKDKYFNRIKEEFDTYVQLDTVDYMLLMTNIIEWCKDNGIHHGYGRGSVNGSLIAYLLGITEMDSIKHNLIFSRFLNKDRVSLPDIDTDFPSNRRQEVIDYIASLDGVEFAEIITFNTMALRGAINEVGRGLNIPLNEVRAITNELETYGGKDVARTATRNKYKDLFKYVDILNGVIISMGSHPSGFVVSPISLDESVSTLYTNDSKYKVTAINMKELDGENYVKLDILGLANIQLMNETCKLAGIERLTPDNVDTTDMNVWKSLRDSTLGIFQMESSTAYNYIKRLFSEETLENIKNNVGDIDYIDLLSIANGAIRPSGASYREQIANGEMHDNNHEALNDFLRPTLGQMVFQEQLMEFLIKFCGFSESESDTVRRGFAKKSGTGQFIPKIEEGFVKYMSENYGESEESSKELLKYFIRVIEDSSDYAFSVNHSQPYSYLGYINTYLRYHYPLEFLTVALNIWDDDESKTANIVSYAKDNNISIKPISFGNSRAEYSFDRENKFIYKGISSIKFLNSKVAEELYELSKNDYDKNNFTLLLKDIFDKTSANTTQMEILIRLDFFKEFGSKEVLLEIYLTMADKKKPNIIKYPEFDDKVVREKKRKRNKVTKEMEDVIVEKVVKTPLKYDKTHKDNTKAIRLENMSNYEKAVRANPPKKMGLHEQISFEKRTLGYAESVFPELPSNIALVTDIDKKYTPKLTLYQVKTGKEIIVKVPKKIFWRNEEDDLLYVGDVIRVLDIEEQYAWMMVDNKWSRDKTRIELHLKKCSIISQSPLRTET